MPYWEKANHSWTKDSTRYILTPSQKTRDLFYYIQEIGHFKAEQPYYTERENLPSFLMKFTLSGQGLLRYHGKDYVLRAGDVFFIDCDHYQHYQTISDCPWEMVWVHFSGSKTARLFQEYFRDKSPVFHTKSAPHDNTINLILERLLNLQTAPNAKTDYQNSILLHELLNELILQKYQLDFTDEEIPPYVIDLKNYLDEHFKSTLTLETLSHHFHLNKYQLNKEFSKYIGAPPIDYLISKKMSHAKDLLRYSKKSIKEIAIDIGIENAAYFSRLFKKKTGLTASDYRKIG
ncbi:AraC family transcriptional regulator [Lactococcus hodotermopsidis]|uniref:AraC family transcriptional regulator n=1 Tax=Pseudolactococcus hodotermopsidis TaxID=2709157 RepID=A0A6A0BCH3_9LACT|nr:AraC family transcriptional regulator [Lactococcus hodotermopsidis]GFH41517.1 AraC family transcriptional regulator [Lactococcus hodotermopsidis]